MPKSIVKTIITFLQQNGLKAKASPPSEGEAIYVANDIGHIATLYIDSDKIRFINDNNSLLDSPNAKYNLNSPNCFDKLLVALKAQITWADYESKAQKENYRYRHNEWLS